jgi:hypothetical protein
MVLDIHHIRWWELNTGLRPAWALLTRFGAADILAR